MEKQSWLRKRILYFGDDLITLLELVIFFWPILILGGSMLYLLTHLSSPPFVLAFYRNNLIIQFGLTRTGIALVLLIYSYLHLGWKIFCYQCWRASGPRTVYFNPSGNMVGGLAWIFGWPGMLVVKSCYRHGILAWEKRPANKLDQKLTAI